MKRRRGGGGACSSRPAPVSSAVRGDRARVTGVFDHVLQELTLPLRHEDIIRQQAREKDVDASLIAAVIYAESRFRDQTSQRGGAGTDADHADDRQRNRATQRRRRRSSSKTSPTPTSTSATGPSIWRNCSTGSMATRSRRWPPITPGRQRSTMGRGGSLTVEEIPFAETRGYVEEVLDKRQDYRQEYAQELGY